MCCFFKDPCVLFSFWVVGEDVCEVCFFVKVKGGESCGFWFDCFISERITDFVGRIQSYGDCLSVSAVIFCKFFL